MLDVGTNKHSSFSCIFNLNPADGNNHFTYFQPLTEPYCQDFRFNQDPYILKHQPKSILCTPLIYQGKRFGILYLENNLTPAAFTPERLEILQFLSTQAAISLDNAQLYNQLELCVQERTLELTQTNDRFQTEILELTFRTSEK